MYSVFYYKDDFERQIVVQDIYSLRDIAHLLVKAKIYFKVIQGRHPISYSDIGFQDKDFWLKPEQCYYRMIKRTGERDGI